MSYIMIYYTYAVQESQRDHTADRFVGVSENLDERLIKTTVGLVTLSDFKKTKDDLEEQQRKLAAQVQSEKTCVGRACYLFRRLKYPAQCLGRQGQKGKEERKNIKAILCR